MIRAATSPAGQLPAHGVEVAEGHLRAREQGAEAVPELLGPVDRQRARRQAVEGVIAVEDAGPAGGAAGELERRLHRLGAAVAHVDPVQVRGPVDEGLGQQPGQERRVHLHQVGQLGVEDVVQGPAHGRVGPPDAEYAETGQEVEVAGAGVVVRGSSPGRAPTGGRSRWSGPPGRSAD